MVSFEDTKHIVAFGAGEVLLEAVETAQSLGFEVSVVTAPRQVETEVQGEQMAALLRSRGIETVVTDDVNDDKEVSALLRSETLGLSFGAAWIFDESFITALDDALVNFHGSRLPQDRGGGGFSWRILRDDPLGYSQAHLITPGIDTGDILLSEEYRFPDRCTTPADCSEYASTQESDFVSRFLTGVKEGRNFDAVGQPDYLSSYWPRLSTEEHGYIDWQWRLEEIVQFIRAFSDPYEGAKTFINGEQVHLKRCESFQGDGSFHPFQTGILYRIANNRGYVATPQGTLVVERVLDENGDSILSELAPGDRFYTPTERLEQVRRTRVRFTPRGMEREEF